MRKRLLPLLSAVICAAVAGQAAVLPPEKLLPDDTLVMVTVPDWAKASRFYDGSAQARLWADPALKAFKEKFLARWKKEVVEPLEQELGIKFGDYTGLAQGQLTLALTRRNWDGTAKQPPGFLLLLDTRDKSGQLKKNLAEVRKKWVDAGQQVKIEKIRDIEFTTVAVTGEDLLKPLEKVFPDATEGAAPSKDSKPKKKTEKTELLIGQSESLLLIGTAAPDLEKVLIRQGGGAAPALAELTAFQADYQARFRDALAYGWINVKPLVEMAGEGGGRRPGAKGPAVEPRRVMEALGLNGLKSLSVCLRDEGDGSAMELHLAVPAAERKGLFRMLVAEAKEAGPPPFVPADAVKFTRWRLDLRRTWDTLETMLTEISPPAAGVIKLLFDTLGKDKDPTFSLRKNFIGNLGDDLITYAKNPRQNTQANLDSAPTLVLLASPQPEQLCVGIQAITTLLPQTSASKSREREFLGRKIHVLPLEAQRGAKGKGGKDRERNLNFCAAAGYLALSTDETILEEFLRNAESRGKALRETPGLNEAAQKAGGMGTGLFGYENQAEIMRIAWEAIRNDSSALASLLSLSPLGERLGMAEDSKLFKEWFDFSLLPDYAKVEKYFHFEVFAGQANPGGLAFKLYVPVPPQLKR